MSAARKQLAYGLGWTCLLSVESTAMDRVRHMERNRDDPSPVVGIGDDLSKSNLLFLDVGFRVPTESVKVNADDRGMGSNHGFYV